MGPTYFTPLLFLLLTLSLLPSTTPSPPPTYSQHCPHILPPSTPFPSTIPNHDGPHHFSPNTLSLYSTYVSPSAHQLLTTTPPSSQITANLIPRTILNTTLPNIIYLDATLSIRVRAHYPRPRYLLAIHGGPRVPVGRGRGIVRFELSGYWDSSSGVLCMVGSGTKRVGPPGGKNVELNVVFNTRYPYFADVKDSLIVGKLESLDFDGSDAFFKPVYVMGFSRMHYNYSLVKEIGDVGGEDVGFLSRRFGICRQIARLSDYFELDCGRNCSRFVGGGDNEGVVWRPRFMSMNEIDCRGERLRATFVVSNVSDVQNGFRQPIDPSRTLVGEGVWDSGTRTYKFVACRIVNFTKEGDPMEVGVGDCSIRLNFTIADTLSIRKWSVISGRIWSEKSVGEEGYFGSIELRVPGFKRAALPNLKYEYTEIDRVKKGCVEKKGRRQKGKTYPDPFSRDLKFDMDVTNGKGKGAWGKAHPVFVGDRYVQDMYPYYPSSFAGFQDSIAHLNSSHNGSLNVAYQISISPKDEFKVGGTSFTEGERLLISAEGIYNSESGHLCMVGCWNRENDRNVAQNASTLDCDVFVNIQFSPQKSDGKDVVKGTIESKRDKSSDPLYFERWDLSGTSLTKSQVKEVFWRMDFEITMVLITNTLACIFVGLQLFHVKKHPDVLPYISVVMLVVITLGHMIPLLLNMEAFFLSAPSKKTVLFGSGGWLEVNEVLVRVITMVAFLLEFRLLQLTWSARGTDDTHKTLQQSDKKVIYYCLPVYAFGALAAWLVQRLTGSPKRSFPHRIINSNATLPFWSDIKSYAGFILDAFLLPQIMFNLLSDSKERALSVPYYLGTTVVRLMPHAYDMFRAHSSSWKFDPWYIYANPGMNYYSTTWDVIISCVGLVFVVFIFLQQRFGGRWIVPKKYSKTVAYEMVPLGL